MILFIQIAIWECFSDTIRIYKEAQICIIVFDKLDLSHFLRV